MWSQINQIAERFFTTDAVKHVFDNIRNLVLSTVVFIAGNYLQESVAPNVDSPDLVAMYGKVLVGIGFLLMYITVFHGYTLLKKKSGIPLRISALIFVIYCAFATMFFLALLKEKGITLSVGSDLFQGLHVAYLYMPGMRLLLT